VDAREALRAAAFDRWLAKFKTDTIAALATTGGETEWGVAYDVSSFTTEHIPCESEADARQQVEDSPTDTGLICRKVSEWVPVDPTSPETTEEQS
jgi:hypothetical protein